MSDRLNLPWWATVALGIVLFLLSQLASLWLGYLQPANLLWAFALAALIAILASGLGAAVARLSIQKQVQGLQESIHKTLLDVYNAAGLIRSEAQDARQVMEGMDRLHAALDAALASAKEVTRVALERFGSLIVTYHDLMDIEKGVPENGEIWVLTSALVLEDNELREVIRGNFAKNIAYTYLIPKEDKVLRNRMIALARKWKVECDLTADQARRLIRCVLVPEHFAYMTVIIYNPYHVPPTVLVKLPTSKVYAKEKYPLIYRLDSEPRDAWQPFLSAIQELIDEHPSCAQVERLEFEFAGSEASIMNQEYGK